MTSKPFNVHFGSPAYTELIENVSETNIPSEPLQIQPVSKFLRRWFDATSSQISYPLFNFIIFVKNSSSGSSPQGQFWKCDSTWQCHGSNSNICFTDWSFTSYLHVSVFFNCEFLTKLSCIELCLSYVNLEYDFKYQCNKIFIKDHDSA